VTHAHADGINGAILQAACVSWALQGLQPDDLRKRAFNLCQNFDKPDNDETETYAKQMKSLDKLLEAKDYNMERLVTALGNNVTAIHSVPSAIYAFLACAQSDAITGNDSIFTLRSKRARNNSFGAHATSHAANKGLTVL
jgi:poly(ADP-ribose) glycohydrolase ARH3